MELEKVWIDLYGSELNDEEIRRLACTHNTANKGSMATNYATRVRACRQWLYKLAGKDPENDETPSSTQQWKIACQKMYAPSDKDPNTLEPTLQAALLSKNLYEEFSKVCEMFYRGALKDQKVTKRKGGKVELTQNQLGMPLQGLNEDSKLAVLREVTTKKLSLKEMKKKCERIKKKQLVVAAFLRHAGESSWEALKERFPLHTTEEKVAQFSESSITKTKTPQEVINFFEKAIEWEKQEGPINLQEEREGIFIYSKGNQYGILMEGNIGNIGTEKIKRIVGKVPFKGFSLVTVSLSSVST
ncbi:uncharacterized protein LOC110241156 [Exaiptasia diaphana]|uniref:Uncharacterized protein n=1 Tax=Exaiptasia diaphana TaxID=2652724 RepID=A0A913XD80_EXADI|nr:uncharacterized protein LOC110241156 [Exaiptasia diaphana]XP_028515510.1 uncharacterized protein LOC110241156 [Exaiptasia diaphana]